MNRKKIPLPALLLCLLLACNGNRPTETPVAQRRTILFYLGGDNSLSNEIETRLEALKTVPIPPGCRLLAYADTRSAAPQLLEITTSRSQNRIHILRQYEETNSASPETLASLLQEIVRRYPSPSYGLVLFSHASGWMPERTYIDPSLRSLLVDGQNEMEIAAFAEALPNQMFDFLIFETCHMAGIEIAWELKNKTRAIIASSAEIVSPGFAPAYTQAIPLLFEPEANLQGFVDAIEADYRGREADYRSLTLSLLYTAGLEDLAALIKSHPPAPTGKATPVQCFDRYGEHLFFDFEAHYLPSIPEAQQHDFLQAIRACVARKTATPAFLPAYGGFEIVTHSGLTTYIPQEAYPRLNTAYRRLRWYREVLEN
jgi:hypothetical protein